MLQPGDIFVCLKLFGSASLQSYEDLAKETGIGSSSLHRAVKRLMDAGLVTPERKVNRRALLEFVLYGVRYAYYVKPGEMTRGVPTAHSAPPLDKSIRQTSDVYVWPDPKGRVQGQAVEPLHKEAAATAQRDPKLYELLALVDAVRIGRSRERKLAEDELRKRLS